ncbi:MAG: DNA polymerase III subunit beta [Candidatus Roizmanbacteria bacterium]
MKFTCNTSELLRCVQIASRFTSSLISSHPSLQGLYIQVLNNTLFIRSTNLSDFFETTISVQAESDGDCIVDTKRFLEFISLVSEKEMTIELKDKGLVVIAGKAKGVFTTYVKGDYPSAVDFDVPLQVLPKEFLERLPFVLFATSKDDARPILTGVLIKNSENETHSVATDGFRLSLSISQGSLLEGECIIPARVLSEIVSLSKDIKEISFGYSAQHSCVMFSLGSMVIISRCIEGEFPPYSKVIPEGFKTKSIFDRQSCIKNVKMTSIFARDLSNIIILDISSSGIVFGAKGTGIDIPQSKQDLIKNEGEDVKVAFNYRFVLDMLGAFDSEEIIVELSGSTAPVVFKSEKDTKKLHVIMPLRTEETEF